MKAGGKGLEKKNESEARLYRDYMVERVGTVGGSVRGIGWRPGEINEVGGEDADEV